LSKDDEDDEEDDEEEERRTRQEEAEEEEEEKEEEKEEEEEATDIKSNNPHLAGGEHFIGSYPIPLIKKKQHGFKGRHLILLWAMLHLSPL